MRRERARETVDDVAGSNRGRTKRCNDARDVSRAASDDDDVATSDERRLVCEFPCVVVAIDVSDSTARGRGIVARAPGGRASARVFVGLRPPRWWRASMTRNRSAPRPRFARTRARRSTRPSPIRTLRGELARLLAKAAPSADADARPRARGWEGGTTPPRRALSARRRWTRSSRASARSRRAGRVRASRVEARSARRAWWPTRSPPRRRRPRRHPRQARICRRRPRRRRRRPRRRRATTPRATRTPHRARDGRAFGSHPEPDPRALDPSDADDGASRPCSRRRRVSNRSRTSSRLSTSSPPPPRRRGLRRSIPRRRNPSDGPSPTTKSSTRRALPAPSPSPTRSNAPPRGCRRASGKTPTLASTASWASQRVGAPGGGETSPTPRRRRRGRDRRCRVRVPPRARSPPRATDSSPPARSIIHRRDVSENPSRRVARSSSAAVGVAPLRPRSPALAAAAATVASDHHAASMRRPNRPRRESNRASLRERRRSVAPPRRRVRGV